LAATRGKVYLEDCESRRHFGFFEKDMVHAVIPVLVFDCVALQSKGAYVVWLSELVAFCGIYSW
jgi:hypothetical protein